MQLNDLRKFLLASNAAGYAGGEEKKWIKEPDGSTTIPFVQGDWTSHDNFFGGEPYGGRLVVSYQQKPVWLMVYYGWVLAGQNPDKVYAILREALKLMPADAPFRGPEELINGTLVYQNHWTGNLEKYSGEETISENEKLIYQANYLGGLVDKN